MDKAAIDTWTRRSRVGELDDLPWELLRRQPLGADAIRALRYMQDIEAHTIVYVRQLLATRAIDDADVATFLAAWFFDETLHGRALARVLETAGHTVPHRVRSRAPLGQRAGEWAMQAIARTWPEFVAAHMAWGAVNELTALAGYQRLAAREPHPALVPLLERIAHDETRHFGFYYQQAERRLAAAPGARRVARWLVERFWAPVGSGVQPDGEVRFLARFLFADEAGRAALRRIDATIRRLPGFDRIPLAEAWMERVLRADQPMPNAPSSTSLRRVQGSVQASRAAAPTAPAGSSPSTASNAAEGRGNAAAIRSA